MPAEPSASRAAAPGLPTGIAGAWGVQEPATRGPKPGLTLEGIVAAALAVADADGLTAVSMNRVAKELSSSAMSLYRYLGSKDELLTLMLDAAYGPTVPRPADETWRAGLARWSWGLLALMREHPWSVQLPISGPPITPNAVAWFEDALDCLRETGLPEVEKASVVLMVSGYVRNQAALMDEVSANFLAQAASPDEAMRSYSDHLRALTTATRYPALHRLLEAGVFDRADGPDDEFTFGLERTLDGIGELIDGRARDGRRVDRKGA